MYGKNNSNSGNSGILKKKVPTATITTPYGKDSSDVSGSMADECGGKRGGGVNNLGHSIKGSSATQRKGN